MAHMEGALCASGQLHRVLELFANVCIVAAIIFMLEEDSAGSRYISTNNPRDLWLIFILHICATVIGY